MLRRDVPPTHTAALQCALTFEGLALHANRRDRDADTRMSQGVMNGRHRATLFGGTLGAAFRLLCLSARIDAPPPRHGQSERSNALPAPSPTLES